MNTKQYSDFDSWFNEPESYGFRSERFYEYVGRFDDKGALDNYLRTWLEAAFNAGRERKRGCKFPDCSCIGDTCSYVHKIVRNPI